MPHTCRMGLGAARGNPSSPMSYVCTFPQVLLAKRKSDGAFYAVKVLQKKSILKSKEVPELGKAHFPSCFFIPSLAWLPKRSSVGSSESPVDTQDSNLFRGRQAQPSP